MQNENKNIPEITNEPFPPSFETPESYNQLNTLLLYYQLPIIDPNDNTELKIQKLKEICQSKYLNLDISELKNLSNILDCIKEYKEIEKQCDYWEIELANINSENSGKYGNRSIEELQFYLKELQNNIDLQEKYAKNKNTIDEIVTLVDYLKNNCSDKICNEDQNHLSYELPLKKPRLFLSDKTIQSLGVIKEDTFGAYVKQNVLKKLSEKSEEWAIVLSRIVKENYCKVETLRSELGIDRVNLLRIIYNYSSKGILEYDRLNDTVSIIYN